MNEWWELARSYWSALQDQGVATLLLAGLSLIISIAAYRRTAQGVIVTQQNMFVEQSRFLDGQWQSLIQMILSRDEFSLWIQDNFPDIYGEDVRKSALQYWLANIISTAYQSHRFRLIERDRFDAHLFSVWLFWGRDTQALIKFLRQGYQSKGFIGACEDALRRIESRHTSAPIRPAASPDVEGLGSPQGPKQKDVRGQDTAPSASDTGSLPTPESESPPQMSD